MTCRHSPGDPNCSSHKDYRDPYVAPVTRASKKSTTPDAENYEIIKFQRVGKHVVLKVLYPNCSHCSYEGHKVMVYLNISEAEMVSWRVMDPHFTDPKTPKKRGQAPGPNARFPGSETGWEDAVNYAGGKS